MKKKTNTKNKRQIDFISRNTIKRYVGNKAGKKGKRHIHEVYAEFGNNYVSFGITTAQFTEEDNGKITENIPLIKNPDPNSKRPSYVRPFHITDRRSNYETDEKYKDWAIDPNDLKKHIPPKWRP
jgi:hypothetical protein